MPPIDTSALAAIFAWVWGQYGKTITDKTLKAAWERLRWEKSAQDYGQKVRRLYGTIQILGQPKPVSLEGIYTAVSLLDRPMAFSRYTVAAMEAEFKERDSRYFHASGKEKRRDGLEMVKEGQSLFILGKPGAGKTTFLKHVALRGVKGELERVPIFVGLKQLADSGLSVFEFVVNEFDVCDFPDAGAYLDRLLKAGKAILLFDGLDEVNVAADERQRLIADVENFTRKYDKCPRLITCRLAANDYLFQGYTYVEMTDFDKQQIGEFVARWFSGDKQQRERRELFLTELDNAESEGLRELARVPLLLALLCLGFEETLKLSSRRVELYEEALDALLKKWDSGRNIRRDEVYRELTLKRKEGMLAQAATETFDRAEYFIPGETLARSFESYLSRMPNAPAEPDGEVVLRAIIAQHGLFLERAHDIYSFAHLTFQEYFTALYVVENEARGTLPRLIEHYDNPRYREVFLLTAAKLPDATAFFDLFLVRLAKEAQRRPAAATLMRQVARQAAAASGETISTVSVRSAYISLAFALALGRTLALVLALALNYDRDLALALALALDLARALDLALAIDLARTLDRDHDLALDRAHDLASSPYARHALDEAIVNALLFLETVAYAVKAADLEPEFAKKGLAAVGELLSSASIQSAKLADDRGSKSLDVLVERINATGVDVNRGVLESLLGELRAIMEEFDLVYPDLDREDRALLNRYLSGNLLLLQCLDQAVVTDRQAIKDRLLLLPEA
jgi:hypothetical protein